MESVKLPSTKHKNGKKKAGIKRFLRISMSHLEHCRKLYQSCLILHSPFADIWNIGISQHPQNDGKTAQRAFNHVWSNDHFGKTFNSLRSQDVFSAAFFWGSSFWNTSWAKIVNPKKVVQLSIWRRYIPIQPRISSEVASNQSLPSILDCPCKKNHDACPPLRENEMYTTIFQLNVWAGLFSQVLP